MRASKYHPSPADERAALEVFEERAVAQGVLLQGQKSRFREAWFVVAKRADTGEALNLSFEVTIQLATNLAAFEEALTKLLAEAAAALVPNETQPTVTLQADSHLLISPVNGNL